MYYFTSVTANYIPKARVLCKSLKEHNNNAIFVLVISDTLPDSFDIEKELFDYIININDIKEIKDIDSFRFKYNIIELCTAVKPFAAKQILDDYNTDKICYIDPDIAVFNSLEKISELLDEYSMVFTPHQTSWDNEDNFIIGNELQFLRKGSMNLGFFAVKRDEEGIKFLKWWSSRLKNYCFDDCIEPQDLLYENGFVGMFTDQKWIDLVPSYFDRYYILKEPGYNLSTWNLNRRRITKDGDELLTNGEKIYFFHFSGYDAGHHHGVMNTLIEHEKDNIVALELSEWYEDQLINCGQNEFKKVRYSNGYYDNGQKISNIERKIYLVRRDIHRIFPNPFDTSLNQKCYYKWVRNYFPECFNGKVRISKKFFFKIKSVVLILFPPSTTSYKLLRKIYRYCRKEYYSE